jgi:hypothetical protein
MEIAADRAAPPKDGRARQNVNEFRIVAGDHVISRTLPPPCLSRLSQATSPDSRRGHQT